MLVTGHQLKNKSTDIHDAVFFNQSAETMTGNECILQDGVFLSSVYPKFANLYEGHPIGILCNSLKQCFLFTKVGLTMMGFDLIDSRQKIVCMIEGTWLETTNVIISADELLMYLTYASSSSSSNTPSSVGVFTQKFISTDSKEGTTDMCMSRFHETHTTTRHLCTNSSTFVFKNDSCWGKVVPFSFSSGFLYQNTIYMISMENSTVYAFPKNAYNDTQLTIDNALIERKHFWRYWKLPSTTTSGMSLSTQSSLVDASTNKKQSSFLNFSNSTQNSNTSMFESMSPSSNHTATIIISSSGSLLNLIEILVLVLVIMLIILTLLLIFIAIFFSFCRKKKNKVKKKKKNSTNKFNSKAMVSLPSKQNEKSHIGKEGSTYKGIATNAI